MNAVKVYYYCPETGLYQGEGFLDKKDLDKVPGVTAVAPPPYAKPEVPVFDASSECWTLRNVTRNRESYG